MLKWFKQLDKILRGDATRISLLAEGRFTIPVAGLSASIILLGVLYGLCAGTFAMIRTGGQAYMQMIASGIKLPMLFFLTLAVTFPSLYVFNAIIGTRLSVISALRLLIAALGVMLVVLASLGPIVVFFALSTKSYPFMVLLNVGTSIVSGVLGLGFLLRTLDRLVIVHCCGHGWSSMRSWEFRWPGSFDHLSAILMRRHNFFARTPGAMHT